MVDIPKTLPDYFGAYIILSQRAWTYSSSGERGHTAACVMYDNVRACRTVAETSKRAYLLPHDGSNGSSRQIVAVVVIVVVLVIIVIVFEIIVVIVV